MLASRCRSTYRYVTPALCAGGVVRSGQTPVAPVTEVAPGCCLTNFGWSCRLACEMAPVCALTSPRRMRRPHAWRSGSPSSSVPRVRKSRGAHTGRCRFAGNVSLTQVYRFLPLVRGGGSFVPCGVHGPQRASRPSARLVPVHSPCSPMTACAYRLQVGTNRQDTPNAGNRADSVR